MFLSPWPHVLLSLSLVVRVLQQAAKIFPGPEMAETSQQFAAEKSDPIWCCVVMLCLCSHHFPNVCLLRDLRSMMWSWHTTWPTWSHASTSSNMRGLTLLHHIQIMCLCMYLNCVSGFNSLSRYCWEWDRRLLRNWNNSFRIRGQALERQEGADSHGWRPCYHGLKCLSFS